MSKPTRRSATRLALIAITAVILPTAPALAAQGRAASGTRSSTGVGAWRVTRLGAGRWQVAWTSPRRLPVRSDRPRIATLDGASVGVPTLAADGRTVRVDVTAVDAPRPAGLAVLLSGSRLDRVATPSRPGAVPRALQQASTPVPVLPADPGVPGPYATSTSDYTRPAVKLAGMPQPIEMVGHVVEPVPTAPTGPRPLVVFLHGRHDYCYLAGTGVPNAAWPCRGAMREVPSHLGYDYVQRLLASQGYATVSVRVNGVNAQDGPLADGGASARASIVQQHLDYWTAIAAAHQVDLTRVVLVGHSRGGEGVDRASLRIPLTAPYRIAGQVLVAPTDFAGQSAPYVPTVTLLPYCDGDVSDLQGQRYTDLSRDVASNDRSLKSSVLILGADHNFFNTEWTPGIATAPAADDWSGDPRAQCGTKNPGRLTAAAQRAVGQAYIAGAVAMFTQPAATAAGVLPMFDGSRVAVRSARAARVLSHALGGDRVLRRPGNDTSLTLPDGADSSFCTGSTSQEYQPSLCGSQDADLTAPQWPARGEQPVATHTFWQLSWTAVGQRGGLHLTRPLDLRGRSLDLRTIVDFRLGTPAVRIRLTDTSGASATLDPDGGTTLEPLPSTPGDGYPQVAKLWAKTVRVEPASAGIDLAHVSDVEIIAAGPRGRLWLADLASTAETVTATAAQRLPTLTLGASTVIEGNTVGTVVARVPYRLSRPMERPGRFRVLSVGQRPGDVRLLTVDLAVGQSGGTIPVGYESDRLDGYARLTTEITAGASTNLMTDGYLGSLTVVDDDPAPKVRITRLHPTVREGSAVQWRVSLDRPTAYDLPVVAQVVRGPGRNLTSADVPASWLQQHSAGVSVGPPRSLASLGVRLDLYVGAGTTDLVVSVPTLDRHDTGRAGALTLRITATAEGGVRTTATSTVTVTRRR